MDTENKAKQAVLFTSSGHVLPMPPPLNHEEFMLPGNSQEFTNIIAFYDGQSNVGAYWTHQTKLWTLMAPIARANFFLMLPFLDAALAQGANAAECAQAPNSNGLKH